MATPFPGTDLLPDASLLNVVETWHMLAESWRARVDELPDVPEVQFMADLGDAIYAALNDALSLRASAEIDALLHGGES